MRCIRQPKRSFSSKRSNLLKTAVVGVTVLLSGLALTACQNKKRRVQPLDDDTIAAIYDDASDKSTVVDAKYSPDKATRIKAVKSLENNFKALVEIACEADFRDSRLAAIKLIEDIDVLIEVIRKTKCKDSRFAAVKEMKIINFLSEFSVDEMKNIDPKFAQNVAEALALDSVFSNNSRSKRLAIMIIKKLEIAHPGSENKYNTFLAIYSTSKRIRVKIVRKFKKEKNADALKIIAEKSEYKSTRIVATRALETVDPLIVPETGLAVDISRFSECKDASKPKTHGKRKTRIRDRIRRAWRGLTR